MGLMDAMNNFSTNSNNNHRVTASPLFSSSENLDNTSIFGASNSWEHTENALAATAAPMPEVELGMQYIAAQSQAKQKQDVAAMQALVQQNSSNINNNLAMSSPTTNPAGINISTSSDFSASKINQNLAANNNGYGMHAKNVKNINLNLSSAQQSELNQFKQVFEQNRDKYEEIAQATGVPAKVIWAIHAREGSCDMTTYLHNGEKLGKTTTLVPAGILFNDWTEAAIDAINRELDKLNPEEQQALKNGDPAAIALFAELYNGTGYRNKGVNSPYVYAGTDQYSCGKYVADGQYDPNHKDQQLGVMAMVMS